MTSKQKTALKKIELASINTPIVVDDNGTLLVLSVTERAGGAHPGSRDGFPADVWLLQNKITRDGVITDLGTGVYKLQGIDKR